MYSATADIFFPLSKISVIRRIILWYCLSPSEATFLNTMFSAVSFVDLYLRISFVALPDPLVDKSRIRSFFCLCEIENKHPAVPDMTLTRAKMRNSSFDSMFTIVL